MPWFNIRTHLGVAVVLFVQFSAVSAETSKKIVLATGQPGGTYLRLGNAIAEVAAEKGLEIEVVETSGSVDNIKRLADGKADLALAQGDIAHQAIRGHKPFEKSFDNLRVITPLYTEMVQILVRSHLYVFTAAGLKGKNVSLGRTGSGTYHTARAVIEASGLSLEELRVKSLDLDQINQQLEEETIDAVFRSSAVPTPAVQELLRNEEVRLIPLESIVIERLTKGRVYARSVVPGQTYPNQAADVPTVGVRALLLARADIDPTVVERLVGVIREKQAVIEEEVGMSLDILLERRGVAGLGVEIHPSAESSLRDVTRPGITVTAILIVVLLACTLIIANRKCQIYIRRILADQKHLLLGFFMIASVLLLGSAGLYLFERHVNESFDSFFKSAWSLIVYVAGGFQTRMPITPEGEMVTVFSVAIAAVLVTWIVGNVISGLTAKMMKEKKPMPKDMKNHIVIVNWDERTEKMIEELRKGIETTQRKLIVVVTGTGIRFPEREEFDSVYQEVGDPASKSTLKRANVQQAHSVTILSAWVGSGRAHITDDEVADTKTIMAILAIRSLCGEEEPPTKVPITAEIRSKNYVESTGDLGRDSELEIVCAEEFGGDILTQCALTPGLAGVFAQLLNFSHKSNEVYKCSLPDGYVGKPFAFLLKRCAEVRESKGSAVIPIGIYRPPKQSPNQPEKMRPEKPQIFLNPRQKDGMEDLQEKDFVFVISYGKPKLPPPY